jgi:hypothetical protein
MTDRAGTDENDPRNTQWETNVATKNAEIYDSVVEEIAALTARIDVLKLRLDELNGRRSKVV